MKFLTALPAQLARLGDLVDRNVTSDLEIHQEGIIHLPPIPFRLVAPGITTAIMGTSFMVRQFTSLTNPDGQQANVIVRLARGLWKLNVVGSYSTNFTVNTAAGSFSFSLVNAILGQNVELVLASAIGGSNQRFDHEWVFSLEDDNYSLDFFLGAPPVAGNNHQAGVCVVGSKLL